MNLDFFLSEYYISNSRKVKYGAYLSHQLDSHMSRFVRFICPFNKIAICQNTTSINDFIAHTTHSTHDFTPQSQLMTKLWPSTRTFKTYCGQLNEFRSLISTGAPDNEIFSIIDYISGHSSVAQLPYRLYLI